MSSEEISSWLTGRLPEGWYDGTPTVTVDREEVVVTGRLATDPAVDASDRAAAEGRLARFREETREQRMRVAREAEHRFGRKVAWGASYGDVDAMFTSLSLPVMTRLRQPERLVLDTLVDAGVARSRSDALAWCVRLVGRNTDPWLRELREALAAVRTVREKGPEAGSAA